MNSFSCRYAWIYSSVVARKQCRLLSNDLMRSHRAKMDSKLGKTFEHWQALWKAKPPKA